MLRIVTAGAPDRSIVISFDACRRRTLSARAAAFILSDVFSLSYDHPDVSATAVQAGFPNGSRLRVQLHGDAVCTPEQARRILALVRRWPDGYVIAHSPDGRTRPFDTSLTAEFDCEGAAVAASLVATVPIRRRQLRDVSEGGFSPLVAPFGL